MRRPILGTSQNTSKTAGPTAVPSGPAHIPLQGAKLRQRLRQTRSLAYVEAMRHLDAGTHHADRTALESTIETIANEFPDLGIEQRPMGIVSRCYLGAPYEVHICDLAGEIIEHFEIRRSMPPLYERARALALHRSYAYIEIYLDTLGAVALDGSVSIIEQ